MKEIYLSKESKEEIEKEILSLEKISFLGQDPNYTMGSIKSRISTLSEIINSSTVLPVYNSWDDVEFYPPDNESQCEKCIKEYNGVIIKK
jgi:hypothetical protein